MNSNVSALATDIITGQITGTEAFSLDEFKNLYRQVERVAQDQNVRLHETHILLLSDAALVSFSTAPRFVLRIDENRSLLRSDFDIVISPRFEGNVKPIPLRAFLWTELVQNWWILGLISLILCFLLRDDSDLSTVQALNQMLIEANALFIGIFVLFTVTQNRQLLISKELVKRGIIHQLMQNDQYITWLAILSLLAAFMSTAGSAWAPNSPILLKLPVAQWSLDPRSWSRGLTIASLVLFVDCLLSVTRYYLRVMRTAVESQMYRDLMGDSPDSSSRNSDQTSG